MQSPRNLLSGRDPREMVLFETAAARAVTGAIVGIGSAQQMSGITCAGDVNLSADDMLEIEQD